jgi:uncharacterized surface protein with fasciclin (FAS1) repeats
VTGVDRIRRVVALLGFVTIGLATGCTATPSIDDGSAVAAARLRDAPVVEASTATTESPVLPTLQEMLAQDRFVPLAVALERSGLDTVIEGLDEFVLLAPTGTAFVSVGTDVGIDYSALMNDPRLLEAVMRYHIVANPSTNRAWRTLNGAVLDIAGSDDTIERIDGVEVLDRIPVRPGTVLVMPRLLVPTSQQASPTR